MALSCDALALRVLYMGDLVYPKEFISNDPIDNLGAFDLTVGATGSFGGDKKSSSSTKGHTEDGFCLKYPLPLAVRYVDG